MNPPTTVTGRWALITSAIGVVFRDPQGLLIGFYDLNGDGVDDSFDGDLNFGRDGGPIDAGDLVQQGVAFRSLNANLITHIWSTEGNYVARLNREVARALGDSQIKERLISRGFNIVASSSESFAAFLRQESDISGRLVRDAGIKPE